MALWEVKMDKGDPVLVNAPTAEAAKKHALKMAVEAAKGSDFAQPLDVKKLKG